jgi:hypothetical protein
MTLVKKTGSKCARNFCCNSKNFYTFYDMKFSQR